MKGLTVYINEKLVISKHNSTNFKVIEDRKDLVSYITKVVNDTEGNVLDLQNIDCSNINSLDSIFPICDIPSYIKTINVTGWNVSNVIEFGNSFGGLYFVEEIIGLDTWDMSSAITISSMFNGCSNLKSLDLSGWDLKNLGNGSGISETSLINVFMNCENLEEIIGIENWDVSRIRKANSIFYHCGVKKVDISNWNLTSCRVFQNIFAKCTNLEEIDMSNVKFSRQFSRLSKAFEGCVSLYRIKGIEKLYVESVIDLTLTFKECKKLKADISKWKIPPYCVITSAFMYTDRKIFNRPDVFKKK